jgi:ubiquinone/menaquinone biosynthesis C-methylase UbiE
MGLYERVIFPRVLDFVMSQPPFEAQRSVALARATGEVLEVGFGTGLNLRHYPPAVRKVVAVDPADLLPQRVSQRIEQAVVPVERVQRDGAQLPFDAGRFDCVVTTWTLCTIPDVAGALAEIRRVLQPAGLYLFSEHGRSEMPGVARWQDRLNGMQRWIGGGCNLNRPIASLIEKAGFRIASLERFCLPRTPRIMGEQYLGYAVLD